MSCNCGDSAVPPVLVVAHNGRVNGSEDPGHRSPCLRATGESLWSAERLDHENRPLRDDKNVDDLVDELQVLKIQFSALDDPRHLSLHTTGM